MFFTPDGRNIVFATLGGPGEIGLVPIEGAARPTWLLNTPTFSEQSPELSPDGKWMAYESNESGREEIYVSPFPKVHDDRVVVSTEGGSRPLWSHDGKKLFYVGGTSPAQRLMSATVQSDGAKFTIVARNPVWNATFQDVGYGEDYDISPDDQRFLMLKEVRQAAAENATGRIFIVQNWTEELKRRVPGARK